MEQAIFIVGVNHRTAPVRVRERLTFAEDEIVPALQRLRREVPDLTEAALFSTCNRVEVAGATATVRSSVERTIQFISADRGVDPGLFAQSVYRLSGRPAARHLFRVAASLDSMVVGEPQILGQMKLAYAQAVEAGSAGLLLHRAFHRAFSVAKRVREATLIGHGSVSVSSVAVSLAGQIFDTLKDKKVMLMGAGRMAELTARHLKSRGIESLLITSRTFDHAVALARELGGTAVPIDNFRPYLAIADVIIGSLATTRPVLGPEEFQGVIRQRRYRPVFLIDLGVPRNFDERLNSMENVYLYDIDDLGSMVHKSRGERQREAERAEEIVELSLDSFWRWLEGLDVVPAIKDIRSSIEQIRENELRRHHGWLTGLEVSERERVEALTRGLTNKLVHRILQGLRTDGADPGGRMYAAEMARRLLCGALPASGDDPEPGDPTDSGGNPSA